MIYIFEHYVYADRTIDQSDARIRTTNKPTNISEPEFMCDVVIIPAAAVIQMFLRA